MVDWRSLLMSLIIVAVVGGFLHSVYYTASAALSANRARLAIDGHEGEDVPNVHAPPSVASGLRFGLHAPSKS